MTVMLTCEELTQLVSSYLDGALSERQHRRFEEHVAICPDCQVWIEQMRITTDLLGRVPAMVIPDEITGDLTSAFANWVGTTGD